MIVLFLLLILSLFLRVVLLNQSLWLDEAISAITASHSFPYQISGIGGDFQPPLYYLFLHFYMRIGNTHEWFLRIPSVFFGVASILVTYKLAQELFGKRTAVITGLLLATSQFHIYYSQELRMYSLFMFLAVLSLYFFYHKKWKLLTLINTLGMYSQYMFVLLLFSQIIWIVCRRNRHEFITWFICFTTTVVCLIPWIPILSQQVQTAKQITLTLPLWNNISSIPFWKFPFQILLKFTLGRIWFENKILYGAILILLIVLYGRIFSLLFTQKQNAKVKFLLYFFSFPLSCGIVLSLFLPIAGVWRFIFLLPIGIMLTSYFISLRKGSVLLYCVLFINLISLIAYWWNPKYQREKWRSAVEYIEAQNVPIVFTIGKGFAPYQWYKTRELEVCDMHTLERCLQNNKIIFVSYLEELFDEKKSIRTKLARSNFEQKRIENFEGIGFLYTYEYSN